MPSSDKNVNKAVFPAVTSGQTLLDEAFKLVPVHYFRWEGLSSLLLQAGLSSALHGPESVEGECDVRLAFSEGDGAKLLKLVY